MNKYKNYKLINCIFKYYIKTFLLLLYTVIILVLTNFTQMTKTNLWCVFVCYTV